MTTQPRTPEGRYGEKLEVGVQRRLTDALRRALGHPGDDTTVPAPDDLDARLAEQEQALTEAAAPVPAQLAPADPLDLTARLEQQEAGLATLGKSLPRPRTRRPAQRRAAGRKAAHPTEQGRAVIRWTGGGRQAFVDDAGALWTADADSDQYRYAGLDSDDAALTAFEQYLATHGLSENGDAPPTPTEDSVTVTDDSDLEARLAQQEKLLAALDDPGSPEALEVKRRAFDEDKHPRDYRGRFASIGSTVSLPAGGGEGRVVAAVGGGKIRVRKGDGSEVDVVARETTVTRSAAANAAHDSFINRAGAGSEVGAVGTVGGSVGSFGGPAGGKPRRRTPAAATRAVVAQQDTAAPSGTGKYEAGARVSFLPYGKTTPVEGTVESFDGDLYRVRKDSGGEISLSEAQLTPVAKAPDAAKPAGSDEPFKAPANATPAPVGGDWGEAPGAEPDDRVDRSTWTGGLAPMGADGSGTRPDGQPWGSGYDDTDPRSDPSYDQYTTELDAKLDAALKTIGDTQTRFDKVEGKKGAYNPERNAMHEAILDELMARYASIPRENRAVVMAGPPGAGKTTVIVKDGKRFGVEWDEAKRAPANYAVVNPDDMKELLIERGMVPDDYPVKGGETATFTHEESSDLADRLLARLTGEGVNVILDGTFSGNPDKQVGKVEKLRDLGYTTRGVLVDGRVERSLLQAGGRHRKAPTTPGGAYEGRYVPIGLIEGNRSSGGESQVFGRPHRNKSSENIERGMDAFDDGVFWYDNSTGASTLVKDTAPAGETALARRWDALRRRLDNVTDDATRQRLATEMQGVMAALDFHDSLADAWLERGGAELEAKVLEALAAQGKAAGGPDRNRGGAGKLRDYWVNGEGAAKIGWGSDGDFGRCVTLVGEHMSPDKAKGYCNLRHRDATGSYAGEGHGGKSLGTVVRRKALPNTNAEPSGVMVALYPEDDVASALTLDNGEPAEELHVTLAYLGDVEDVGDVDALVALVEEFARTSYDVDAEVSGLGRWSAGEDGDAFVALIDAPELPDLRTDLVDALDAGGFPVARNHGFTPHITLAYLAPEDPTPLERIDALPATFGMLSLAVGSDVWDFPLVDNEASDTSTPPAAVTMGGTATSEGDAPYDKPEGGTA